MSHHGNQNSEAQRAMSAAMRELMGEYPRGRLNADDAGAVAIHLGVESGKVRVDFPKPVAWFAMTGDEAMGLANALIKHARAVGLKNPATLVL